MGNKSSSRSDMFSIREIQYLESLPAVESVDKDRIHYTDDFKRECMRRYRAGESPLKIFHSAGLDVALIGYKRIERCVYRWKRSARLNSGVQPERTSSQFEVVRSLRWLAPGQARDLAGINMALDDTGDVLPGDDRGARAGQTNDSARVYAAGGADESGSPGTNQLDDDSLRLIVRQQAYLIDELEREVKRLRGELKPES